MAYTRTTWRTGETPLSAGNMNNIEDGIEEALAAAKQLTNLLYPVGCYFETSDTEFDPNESFEGVWVLETAGQVHISAGSGYTVNGALTNTSDGGYKDATLPSHTHPIPSLSGTAASSGGHDHTASAFLSGKAASGSAQPIPRGKDNGSGNFTTSWNGAHTHSVTINASNTSSAGTSPTGKNLPPYIVVNRWHRTL